MTKEEEIKQLCANIRYLRERAGLSKTRMAKIMGVTTATLTKSKKGPCPPDGGEGSAAPVRSVRHPAQSLLSALPWWLAARGRGGAARTESVRLRSWGSPPHRRAGLPSPVRRTGLVRLPLTEWAFRGILRKKPSGGPMTYSRIQKGVFLERPNRFVARVELGGQVETCHVKNTGRCKELLLPGAEVYLEESANPARKTKYDLVAVQKGARLINMDSQAPNRVVEEWLRGGGLVENLTVLRPECRYRHSRFDFYLEANGREAFVEVKGVTLEEGNEAFFPTRPPSAGSSISKSCAPAEKTGMTRTWSLSSRWQG